MGCATDILLIAQGINHDFSIIDATETESNNTSTYDAVITNKALRRKQRSSSRMAIMPVLLKKHTNC